MTMLSTRRHGSLEESTFLVLVVVVLAAGSFHAELRADDNTPADKSDEIDKFQFVAFDAFDGKLSLNWQPIRHDPTHASLTKNDGKMTITTQRGSIHAMAKIDAVARGSLAKNIFVIENPLAKETDFVVSTCISGFVPSTQYQQAGLILYDDDDNYVKLTYESNWPKGEGQNLVLVRESAGKPEHDRAPAEPGLKQYWVRLTKRGKIYEFSASKDGKKFTVYGEKPWDGGPKKIGLLAKNGGGPKEAPELDAAFEFFEVRALPLAAKK